MMELKPIASFQVDHTKLTEGCISPGWTGTW
jgi:S-ribosylhomocysteine lyase LuxS involved in autoinducer biosynthesis